MVEVGLKVVGAFDGGIDETGAIAPERFEECTCIPAILGASALIARIECSVAPIGPEIRPIPQRHHPEHARPDAHLACRPITLE
ncbi:MAG: hypothetical protein ABSH28_00470 [Acidobacteriota bacterium]|jgi:hypothetical protein